MSSYLLMAFTNRTKVVMCGSLMWLIKAISHINFKKHKTSPVLHFPNY